MVENLTKSSPFFEEKCARAFQPPLFVSLIGSLPSAHRHPQSLDEDVALARALPSIALVLGGHEHVPFAQMEGGTLIFKTGQNAQWLGAVR